MVKYAALLRGMSPSNPNMRNEKLRSVLKALVLRMFQTVISSGNILFESPPKCKGTNFEGGSSTSVV